MTDIDFDELDKAVNSLMGGVKVKSDQPAPMTLKINTTLKEGEQPKYDNIQQAAEKIGSEAIAAPAEKTEVLSATDEDGVTLVNISTQTQEVAAPAPSAEPVTAPVAVTSPAPTAKGSGRFMDVMHPSSDMKSTTETKAAPVAESVKKTNVREATTIEPPKTVEPPELEVVAPPVPVASVEETKIPEPLLEDNVPEEDIQPVSVTQIKNETTIPEPVTETQAPLTSPFLSGAKVEKRPLGGAPSEEKDDSADVDVSTLDMPYTTDNSSDTQLAPTQADEPELPAELHTELLAIETNLANNEEAVPAKENSDETEDLISKPSANEPETPRKTQAVAATELPSDGAIFDTTEYHKSVSHPAKHTSEWIWIAVIVGIVLVCAVGAAAFYLLGTQ